MVEHSPGLREVRGSNPGTADQCFSAIFYLSLEPKLGNCPLMMEPVAHGHNLAAAAGTDVGTGSMEYGSPGATALNPLAPMA